MQTLQDLSSDSTPKKPRKRRSKVEPTEDELLQQFRTARRALADKRKRTRDALFLRLGTLAYHAGLGVFPDEVLQEAFADLTKRLSEV